ncbi:MAG: nucleotide exchange factor GrpE [Leptolyngbyaceae cyanobacterium]
MSEEHQVSSVHNPTDDLSEPPSTLSEGTAFPVESGSPAAEGIEAGGEAPETPETGVDFLAAIAQMDEEMKTLKSQLDERSTQYMRIAADFENFRKRVQREKEDMEQQIKCSVINELLPVVDNFERARSQIKPQTDQETNIHKSYQSVYKQLVDCLKRVGVAPMRSEGQEFDPNLHEAVMRQPTDEYPEGTVMEELQRGYKLGDRVLRHALVKVAVVPESTASSETDQVSSS